MRITRLYLRFFKSFNFDYRLRADPRAEARPWEQIEGEWFPFVCIDIEPSVTAVVGANESGKSHLIDAIELALRGSGIDETQFCRYSTLFSAERNHLRVPDLGLELELRTDVDVERVEPLGLGSNPGDRFKLFRLHEGGDHVLEGDELRPLNAEESDALNEALPIPFRIEPDIAIPDSVSFDVLMGRDRGPLSDRTNRFNLFGRLRTALSSEEEAKQRASELAAFLTPGTSPNGELEEAEKLGRKLLLDIAHIDPGAIANVEQALSEPGQGEVGGYIADMNRLIDEYLNFEDSWHQDQDFRLEVSARETELTFTIRDRTGTEYSFSERSRGLTYFLSYYVQLLAHPSPPDRSEVLLMDEPDTFLSNVGQQDLLRILEDFALPPDRRRADQVVYVTHSPFLINKNAADRIRVLDKGSNREGTRVVRGAAHNRYEPLRSAIGTYVAETAFIGGANLFVEGPSDQVLLTGLVAVLRDRHDSDQGLIDLNEITVVPAGGAQNVPYMVYLARGRDETKPPCVALLDGDKDGRDAKEKLERHDVSLKPILASDYVVELAEWAGDADLTLAPTLTLTTLEDLIPVPAAVAAARAYARHFLQMDGPDAEKLTEADVSAVIAEGKTSWKALSSAFSKAFRTGLDKVGFAKELIQGASGPRDENNSLAKAYEQLEDNFAQLISTLDSRLRRAKNDEDEARATDRIARVVRGFLKNHPSGGTKDKASEALTEIEALLEESAIDDQVRAAMTDIRDRFDLSGKAQDSIADFDGLRRSFEGLVYQRANAYEAISRTP